MTRTILFSGGGTLGPVTPLLAVATYWQEQEPDIQIVWVGTPHGPERDIVERYGYAFHQLSAPKLSRHAWWSWPLIPFQMAISLWQAGRLLQQIKPDMVISAGGYTSVPLAWMAGTRGIPVWVHQLDVVAGLANKLMAPLAVRVSVTWEESAHAFGEKKTLVVGGLVRTELFHGDRERFLRERKLDPSKPTVLVLGGGTGAMALNEALQVIIRDLAPIMNVVHLTGKGKGEDEVAVPGYCPVEFLNADMKDAFAAADVVVCRAGMGTILELLALEKPSILVPIPDSHQEDNARVVQEKGAAAVITTLTPQTLLQEMKKLVEDRNAQQTMRVAARKALMVHGEKKIVEKAREILVHE